MMTSPCLVLYLACLFLGKTATTTGWRRSPWPQQEGGFIVKNAGEEVTLSCVHEIDISRVYWYKQSLGQKPRLICRTYQFGYATFYNEFQNNPRFTLGIQTIGNNLKITDLQISDSATYYCASEPALVFTFQQGTTVHVKGSDVSFQTSIIQSESETVQLGGSVTLNCTVQAGSCDEEHSVYWFRISEAPQPGFLYIRGDRGDQCERKSSNTPTCEFNLPIENLTGSHAGTYHCAVASCGHILFGNGTKLDFVDTQDYLVSLYLLIGVLAFTTIFSVLSTFFMYKMNKKIKSQIPEHQVRFSTNPVSSQEEDSLHYAALRTKSERPRRQMSNMKNDCVYSGVKP